MPLNRYKRAPKLAKGTRYGTWNVGYMLLAAMESGRLDYTTHITVEGERLDIIAGAYYGDGTLWWVIAGCSGIGWGLQVPPGIYLKIPTDIGQIMAMLG